MESNVTLVVAVNCAFMNATNIYEISIKHCLEIVESLIHIATTHMLSRSTHEGPVIVAVLWMRRHDTQEASSLLQIPIHVYRFLILTSFAIASL